MRKYGYRLASLLLAVCLLASFSIMASASTATARGLPAEPAQLVMGGSYRLSSGQTLNENLYVLGGTALLEEGSTVNGNIYMLGGTLEASGTVNGSISLVGGNLNLSSSAVVTNEVYGLSSVYSPAEGAQVGAYVEPPPPTSPYSPTAPAVPVNHNIFGKLIDFFMKVSWKVLQSLALAAFAALTLTIFPQNMERARATLLAAPIHSVGTGILAGLLIPIALVVMVLTLILIPVAFVAALVILLGWLFSWTILGYETGIRMERSFKVDWQPPITAGVGTFTLSILFHLVNLIPCVGWFAGVMLVLIGFGAVVLSRFGTTAYLPSTGTPSRGMIRPIE